MANQTVTDNSITVHGRGSLVLPFKVKDANDTQIDISTWTIYFEVDGVPIREALVADPADALGKLIKLERAQIATLKTSDCKFIVVDETQSASDLFTVLWEGTIKRTGFVGTPDTSEG